MPDYHDLSYKGRIIRMEIVNKSSGSIADGIYMAWEIKRIYIPPVNLGGKGYDSAGSERGIWGLSCKP